MKKLDLHDIKGQEHCKRAIEVACVGDHGIVLIGPHHSGKSALIKRIPTITDRPIFTAEMLPCPCGNFTDPKRDCFCSPRQIQEHLIACVSGEIFRKADMHVEVPKLKLDCLSDKRRGETSEAIRARIEQARKNSKPYSFDKEANELFKLAVLELGISPAAYDKIAYVASTIAQMDGKPIIEAHHLSEAISYRSLDRTLWS